MKMCPDCREVAARVCESLIVNPPNVVNYFDGGCITCSKAIRALPTCVLLLLRWQSDRASTRRGGRR